MTPRNESIPRQSNLFAFISQEEFEQIPEYIWMPKADEGVIKHKLLQDTYHDDVRDNIIVRMFKDGLKLILTTKQLKVNPTFEEQLNGERFTGAPDFRLLDILLDYKFTDLLRPKTALQLVAYAMLIFEVLGINIDRHFGFHFPDDRSLFIHKVPSRTVPVLVDFTKFVIDHHQEIVDGKLVRYDALIQWDEIQQDYEIFEYVASVLPPMMITNRSQAVEAARKSYLFGVVKKQMEVSNTELKRYMADIGDRYMLDGAGYGVRLDRTNKKMYNEFKKSQALAKYNKELEDCIIDTEAGTRLMPVKPSLVKKPRQIS